MAQSTVSRRRPCRKCGQRYFIGRFSVTSVIIALVAAVGGAAKSAVDSAAAPAGWVFGGLAVAVLVLIIGHGYRCVSCDTHQ